LALKVKFGHVIQTNSQPSRCLKSEVNWQMHGLMQLCVNQLLDYTPAPTNRGTQKLYTNIYNSRRNP